MGVGIYYFYHGFGFKAFEGRHIRILFIRYQIKGNKYNYKKMLICFLK